jgi:hypothetical protein
MNLSKVYLLNGRVRAWRDDAGTLHANDSPDPARCTTWRTWLEEERQREPLRDAVWGTLASVFFVMVTVLFIACMCGH